MWLIIFLCFTILPAVELALLIFCSVKTSFWLTLAIILITGFVGAELARHQGIQAWRRIQSTLAAGQIPGAEVVDAVLILLAGAFLLTPGFITDLTGFLLLLPPVRKGARAWLSRRFARRVHVQSTGFGGMGASFVGGFGPGSGAGVGMGGASVHRGPSRLGDDGIIDVVAETVSTSTIDASGNTGNTGNTGTADASTSHRPRASR